MMMYGSSRFVASAVVWLGLTLSVSTAAAVAPDGLVFTLALEDDAPITPFEAATVRVTLANTADRTIHDLPPLTTDAQYITFELTSAAGSAETLRRPVNHVIHTLRATPGRTLSSGAEDNAVFRLAYDWETERYCFPSPGTYTLRATLRAHEAGFEQVSESVTVEVRAATRAESKEIARLMATEAYPFLFAPEALTLEPRRDTLIRRLRAFIRRHPRSRYATDAPFLIARHHEYSAFVLHDRSPRRQRKAMRVMREALADYLGQSAGAYRAEAQVMQRADAARNSR